MKIFFYITFLFVILLSFNNCGKKDDLEKPGKNYPKEYPNE